MYHVLFGPNDVRQMTLDQVDDCFRLGVISEETMLWTDGMKAWETLKEAAGLGESSGSSKAPPPPRRPNSGEEHRTRSAPKEARGGSRRPGRAEPPPRRRATSRGASSPEVITSARPLPTSQPGPGQAQQRAVMAYTEPPAAVPAPHLGAPEYASRSAMQDRAAPVYTPHQHAPTGNPFLRPAPSAQAVAYDPSGMPAYQAQPYLGQAAIQLAPVYQAPVHQAPVHQAPVHQAPVHQAPVHQAPVHQAPAGYPMPLRGAPAQHNVQMGSATWPTVSASAPPNSGVRYSAHTGPYGQPSLAQPSFQQQQPLSHVPHSLAPMAMTTPSPSWTSASVEDDVPFARSARRGGTRAHSWLLTLCVLAGVAVVSYRNDYLFQIARSARHESTYLALERQYLGGAPEGTPRDVKKLVDGIAPAIQTVVFGRDNQPLENGGLGRDSAGRAPASAPEATNVHQSRLPLERGAVAEPTPKEPVVAEVGKSEPVGASPANSSIGARDAKPSSQRAANNSARSPESTSQATRRSFAGSSDDREKPARPTPGRPQKSEPEPRAEPTPAAGTDDFLHMSMRQAIKKKAGSGSSASSSEPPKKKKTSRADYDPLNGDI